MRHVGVRAWDIEKGDKRYVGVHVVRSVLVDDGVVRRSACHGCPHVSGHVGEDRPRNAAQDERTHYLDFSGGAYYGPPVFWLRPVPLLLEGLG